MNRKGFTLIELLGVILIISLLVIIVLPNITNSVNNFMPKTDKLMMNMIEEAARLYVEDNINSFEENEYGYYCVPLTELVNNDYLKSGIEISGKDITNSKSLKINYNEDNKIELVDSDKCVIAQEPTKLAAGLYDENDVLLASWDELNKIALEETQNERDFGMLIEEEFEYVIAGNIIDFIENAHKLVIADVVTSIGDYAFYGCTGLISIMIPNSVTSIGDYAFDGCTGLTSITIPNSVTSIGDFAFSDCTGLTSITIPNSVTSIGMSAFSGCTGLTSLMIPNSVTSIGEHAFLGCTSLTSIIVDPNNSVYDSRDNSNAIIETTTDTLILGCKTTIIPNSVTNIGSNAFLDCTDLTSITIPDSVTSIGGSAFSGCTGLTSITIPDSVTSIDISAFSGCTGLTSITIPDSVTRIGVSAFSGCTGLTSITIPDSVTSIGMSAFSGCTSLTSITIPDSVTSIENSTFNRCTSLSKITLSNNLTSIGNSAFSWCNSLVNITIPSSVTYIGTSVFHECTKLTTIYYSGPATGANWGAPNAAVVS